MLSGAHEPQMPGVQKGNVVYRHLVPGAKRVIAVGSGKGGVGKSSMAVNLAIALARSGKRVGLLDADIYGPSVPKMLGTQGAEITMTNDKLDPIECFGIKTISIGNVVPPDRAAVWRGPMVHKALMQLLGGVNWGELDFLILDLPPGTGDVHLTLVQSVQVDAAVIVSTPQEVALLDVRKCIDMFRVVNIRVAGVIENMAYFEDPHGQRHYLFGEGGAMRLAEELKLPVLGQVPMLTDIMHGGERGEPYAVKDHEGVFAAVVEKMEKVFQ